VLDTSGTLLETLQDVGNLNPQGAWFQLSHSLLAYRGQTIRVRIRAITDGSLPTWFYVDNVSVATCK